MFVDFKDQPTPPPWHPRPARRGPQLTARQQRALGAVLGFNILLLLVAPIGGATIIELVVAMLR